jgi:hypothetical protein
MQRLIRHYKDETGITDVDMKEVAKFAVSKGWPMPVPKSPLDLLAKQFTNAARQEIRHDDDTGRPYRANHSFPHKQGNETLHLWIDIDDKATTRKKMQKSLTLRREQMVGDGLQLTYDADHWNASHPDEEPIQLEMDLSFDIELRKNAADADDEEDAA